jgi:hypothetical protein
LTVTFGYIQIRKTAGSEVKAATFLQLERRISMMMDVQISSGLPLAQDQIYL